MNPARVYLGEQLEARIERYQVREVHRNLDAQLEAISQEGLSLHLLKYRCVLPLSRCANGAVRAGVPGPGVMVLFFQRLRELSRLKTWAALRQHLHRFADEM